LFRLRPPSASKEEGFAEAQLGAKEKRALKIQQLQPLGDFHLSHVDAFSATFFFQCFTPHKKREGNCGYFRLLSAQ
jgi:hypothetical protein